MKHQSYKDRMHEHKGMEHKMSHSGPMEHFHQSMREESSHHMYKNEVEMPEMAAMAHPGMGEGDRPGMGCMDFKKEADPIAYGQAQGHMKEDHRRIESQFKDYHWD